MRCSYCIFVERKKSLLLLPLWKPPDTGMQTSRWSGQTFRDWNSFPSWAADLWEQVLNCAEEHCISTKSWMLNLSWFSLNLVCKETFADSLHSPSVNTNGGPFFQVSTDFAFSCFLGAKGKSRLSTQVRWFQTREVPLLTSQGSSMCSGIAADLEMSFSLSLS